MKHFISFCCVILLAAGLFSCATSPASIETGSPVWKITKNGNTLFLGGSIHLLREADFPLPAEFDLAFSRSDVLVLEADTAQLEDPQIQQYLMSQIFLPEGKTVQSLLDPQTYQLLSSVCNEYGFSVTDVDNMKPSMILNLLAVLMFHEFGFVEQGVDDYLLEKAAGRNMPVKFLESIQSQIDLIVTMGEGYENEYVLYSLQDMENTEEQLDELVAEWRRGEESKVMSLNEMKEQWPLLYSTLITDRHNLWYSQLEGFLSSGQVHFVIAGFAHMHGPDGLLRFFLDIGCRIERVM